MNAKIVGNERSWYYINWISLQALDEEYLKVDAQFGGVDQRKIFTFAKKVRIYDCKYSINLLNALLTYKFFVSP